MEKSPWGFWGLLGGCRACSDEDNRDLCTNWCLFEKLVGSIVSRNSQYLFTIIQLWVLFRKVTLSLIMSLQDIFPLFSTYNWEILSMSRFSASQQTLLFAVTENNILATIKMAAICFCLLMKWSDSHLENENSQLWRKNCHPTAVNKMKFSFYCLQVKA